MMTTVLQLTGVHKSYGGLRPLRLDGLCVPAGRSVALVNMEAPAVEVLINLVTGATLPDEGEVRIFGRPTSAIESGDDWLVLLERFGIVSERVVLLEGMSIAQNLALPYTLELDPIPATVQGSIAGLAAEVLLAPHALQEAAAASSPEIRFRLRLARALALEPQLLLLEHPTVGLPREAVARLASDVRTIARARRVSVLTMTADRAFAEAAADTAYTLEAATGRLVHSGGWRRWLGRSG